MGIGGFGLMAGALSRGITDTEQGLNQGLLQGEGVRAERAREGLAQQHFGLQQQQLTNALAQQAFHQGIARANLGLQQQHIQNQADQIAAMNRYHEGLLRYHGDENAYRQALLPSQIQRNQAVAGWNQERPRGGGTALFRNLDKVAQNEFGLPFEELTDEQQTIVNDKYQRFRNPRLDTQIQNDVNRGKIDQARLLHYGDMHQRAGVMLNQLQNNPKLSPQHRIQMMMVSEDMKGIRQALGQMQRSKELGIPFRWQDPQTGKIWDEETLANAQMKNDQILQQIAQSYAPGGAGAQAPTMSLQDAMKQFNLTPPPKPAATQPKR